MVFSISILIWVIKINVKYMLESKSQIIARVRKERNAQIVVAWHAQCDESINDTTISAVTLEMMQLMRPMYDYLVQN